jgi:uncharacterized protein
MTTHSRMICPPTLEQRLAMRERPAHRQVMHQRWEDLLFLHWRWDADVIQRTLPPGLHVDTHEGEAWIGLVPFFMRGIRPVGFPAVPWISNFLEMNLRTYVHDDEGRPGVWFWSLECDQPLAVWIARAFFSLPYQHSTMSARRENGSVRYTTRRRGDDRESRLDYRLHGTPVEAQPGTLEFFLAERYALFSQTKHGLKTGRVHHTPYPLVNAEVTACDTRLFSLCGFEEPGRAPDHIIASPGVDVAVFGLRPTDAYDDVATRTTA